MTSFEFTSENHALDFFENLEKYHDIIETNKDEDVKALKEQWMVKHQNCKEKDIKYTME